jgi:hypothetical protein
LAEVFLALSSATLLPWQRSSWPCPAPSCYLGRGFLGPVQCPTSPCYLVRGLLGPVQRHLVTLAEASLALSFTTLLPWQRPPWPCPSPPCYLGRGLLGLILHHLVTLAEAFLALSRAILISLLLADTSATLLPWQRPPWPCPAPSCSPSCWRPGRTPPPDL